MADSKLPLYLNEEEIEAIIKALRTMTPAIDDEKLVLSLYDRLQELKKNK